MRPAETIAFVALDRQHAALRAELRSTFDRVLDSSGFILGVEVERFERAFASYCATDHCVGVASGTAALGLTLAAAGIGPGDEVILAAHGFVASALAVQHAGAEPVFCDVDPRTGLLDPEAAAGCVSGRTAAIMPVHLYGQMCEMDPIMELARRRGLFVLEDAAQAHGARHRGRRAGSIGAAGAFSFYPSKNLGALGDGGAVTTDDATLAARVRSLRDLGREPGGLFAGGRNERLDGLQAAILSVKLRRLDGWNAARREHAARYREALAGEVEVLEERPHTPCVYHLFPIRIAERDRLAGELAAAGIATGVHYAPALYRQPPFTAGARAGEFPEADAWASQELSLPISPELRPDERERVARVVLGLHAGMGALARG